MTINEIQDDIIAEFSDYDDWMDKYQLLIDLGNEQKPLDEQYKNESNLIEGCQSRVWLQADLTEEGKVHFQAESDALIVKGIISIGISPFAMNACACLVVIFINNSLMHYGGDMAVGGYGIANRIVFIFVMITLGVCQGMQPITGYNYGAQNYNRMLEALKLATIAGTIVCAVGFVLAMLCPRFIASMFTSDPSLIEHSVVAMQYIMALFIIIGARVSEAQRYLSSLASHDSSYSWYQ